MEAPYLLWRAWDAVTGPSGWRSLVAPVLFAVLGIGLLVYDHLNQRVTDVVFWLTLLLIVSVFARMLETNRRQSRELEEGQWERLRDAATGLPNRSQLEAHLASAGRAGGPPYVLALVELDGLDSYADRSGSAAGEEALRGAAARMAVSAAALGGSVYRAGEARLAALVPCGERQPAEIAHAIAAQARVALDPAIAPSLGEAELPAEATDGDSAIRVAGQRLGAHRQRQHRSARRQAHAVLMAALSARRPDLRDHLRSVAYRSISLSRRLGLSPEEIDDVALAAELQEAGLLAVPESVLEKEGPLSTDDRETLGRHTVEGERIVGAASGLEQVAALIRSSAERFDGSGRPDGLAGEAIPLGSRIVAVAVAFAALTANRPYRRSLDAGEALAELRRCSGSQFDPRVVEALAAELAEEAVQAIA